MRAVQVSERSGPLELVERDVPAPGRGEVLVRVEACGICHSDVLAKDGVYPGVTYPVVPGHEIAGVVDSLGEGVEGWQAGQRVGVGWFGGHCGHCAECRRGDLIMCENAGVPGVTFDGGYAEYVVVPAAALAAIPDELVAEDAAPLLCAGVTTFNALRHSGARPGDLVAILGIGGLGHLAVQFSARLGFDTVAIARGKDKEELARKLGARHYIDSTASDPGRELRKLGGAAVVLATVTSAKAMTPTINGLAPRGRLVVLGVSGEPIEVYPAQLIGGGKSITGHPSGTSSDSEDTLRFSALTDVRPMIETVPLEEAPQAYERMMSGDARFRMVITMGAG